MRGPNALSIAFAIGIFFLSFTIAISTAPSPVSSELLTSKEFWASIVGAIVGGSIALATQLLGLREARKQREEDQKQRQKALGHSLLFKMIRIYSNIRQIHMHLEEAFAAAAKRGEDREPWTFVFPLANPPSEVRFTSDEMALLLSQGEDATFNAVADMDEIHNGLVQIVSLIGPRRQALLEKLSPSEGSGPAFSAILTESQMAPLRGWMFELNDLITQARARAAYDAKESARALERLHRVLREKLGLAYKLEVEAAQVQEEHKTE